MNDCTDELAPVMVAAFFRWCGQLGVTIPSRSYLPESHDKAFGKVRVQHPGKGLEAGRGLPAGARRHREG
jgi:hypothetical protein